ncbi:MAG: glycosyltransferase family 4 protein [Alphaproteobacteria bacterium]|nr:glycosyltransferase family 4 protein [Alphaproteobacteria bacterium]
MTTNRKRISILNLMLGKFKAGTENGALELHKQLRKLNYDSSIVGVKDSWLERQCVKKSFFISHIGSIFNPICYFQMSYIFRKVRPDIIILHGGKGITFYRHFQKLLPKYRRAKTVQILHLTKLYKGFTPDFLFTLNKSQDDYLDNHNFAKSSRFYLPLTTGQIVGRHNSKRRTVFTCGIASRISSGKGLEKIIDVWANLLLLYRDDEKKMPKLIIAGEGPIKDKLVISVKNLGLQKFIDFSDWIKSSTDFTFFFDKIDLFINPSAEETFGLANLDAIQNGTPVLAMKTGFFKDYFSNSSLDVDTTSLEFAKCIMLLQKNKRLCSDMQKGQYNTVRDNLTERHFQERLVKYIDKIISI